MCINDKELVTIKKEEKFEINILIHPYTVRDIYLIQLMSFIDDDQRDSVMLIFSFLLTI